MGHLDNREKTLDFTDPLKSAIVPFCLSDFSEFFVRYIYHDHLLSKNFFQPKFDKKTSRQNLLPINLTKPLWQNKRITEISVSIRKLLEARLRND